MISTVTCPSCGEAIEVTQALVHQIQEQLLTEVNQKHQQELASLEKKLAVEIQKQFEERNAVELQDLKKQLQEKDIKVREMQKEELSLREQKRKLEEREKEMELEVSRKFDEQRKLLEEAIVKRTQESYRMKELENEKRINDLKKALEEAQRKASQGSQQTQGEVAELDLEQSLRNAFPTDTIMSVEKGIRGADVRQVVKTTMGNICGTILWESKRTKSWASDWIPKLKEDLRNEKANVPIIVSSVLPEEAASGFGIVDGVYVVRHTLALPVAGLLRQKLIDIAREKFITQNKENSAEQLYTYVTSHEFRQHIEAIVEVFQDMQVQITKEKAAFEKIWKTREGQVQKLLSSTASIVGSMSGRVGQSFQPIKGLELLEDGQQHLL